jgi:hypothetical protein
MADIIAPVTLIFGKGRRLDCDKPPDAALRAFLAPKN